MNRTASDTIAAVIQMLIFFLEDSSIFFCVHILINIIGNEAGDKSNVTYNWSPQKKGSAKQKVWEPLIYSIKQGFFLLICFLLRYLYLHYKAYNKILSSRKNQNKTIDLTVFKTEFRGNNLFK